MRSCVVCPVPRVCGRSTCRKVAPTSPLSPQKSSDRFVISLGTWAISTNCASKKRRVLFVTTGSPRERAKPTAAQVAGAVNNGKLLWGDWLCDLSTAPQRRRKRDSRHDHGGLVGHDCTQNPRSDPTNRRGMKGRVNRPAIGLHIDITGALKGILTSATALRRRRWETRPLYRKRTDSVSI